MSFFQNHQNCITLEKTQFFLNTIFKKFEWEIDGSPNSVHPLFMGFSEGRSAIFGAVRTETYLHSLCRVVKKEDRMSMTV